MMFEKVILLKIVFFDFLSWWIKNFQERYKMWDFMQNTSIYFLNQMIFYYKITFFAYFLLNFCIEISIQFRTRMMLEKVILIKIVFFDFFILMVWSRNFPFFAKNALKSIFLNLFTIFKNPDCFIFYSAQYYILGFW